jgi:processive 1,2-diacylglycerol beta-glucosyltransferase
MKVLILSCSTGEGHNAAANAVYENLLYNGVDCEMLDMLSLVSGKVSRRVSGIYVFTTRIPVIFKTLYSAGRLVSSSKHKSPVYYVNGLVAAKLDQYIRKNKYDLIITSHLFPAETLTRLKKDGRLRQSVIAVATDYTCIPFWEETDCDVYVIPHKDLENEFVDKGIDREKLFSFGIPVKRSFSDKKGKKEARRKIGLDEEKPMFLIMSGSMGFGKIRNLTKLLSERCKNQENIVIICGTNKKLKKVLEYQFMNKENVHVKGYTKEVSVYMDACDVLFTKPGGLTSTEAAVKNVPLVHTNPIPGCETKNAEFFSSRGMSYFGKTVKEQINAAFALMKNMEEQQKMLKAQRDNTNGKAAEDIYRTFVSGKVEE